MRIWTVHYLCKKHSSVLVPGNPQWDFSPWFMILLYRPNYEIDHQLYVLALGSKQPIRRHERIRSHNGGRLDEWFLCLSLPHTVACVRVCVCARVFMQCLCVCVCVCVCVFVCCCLCLFELWMCICASVFAECKCVWVCVCRVCVFVECLIAVCVVVWLCTETKKKNDSYLPNSFSLAPLTFSLSLFSSFSVYFSLYGFSISILCVGVGVSVCVLGWRCW